MVDFGSRPGWTGRYGSTQLGDQEAQPHLVSLNIEGRPYVLRTTLDRDYVRQLAEFVSQRIEKVRKDSRPLGNQDGAVFVAMGLADEIFRIRAWQKNKSQELDRASIQLITLFDAFIRRTRKP